MGFTSKQFAPSIIAALIGATVAVGTINASGTVNASIIHAIDEFSSDGQATFGTTIDVGGTAAIGGGLTVASGGANVTGGFVSDSATIANPITEGGWTPLTQAVQQTVTNASDQDSNTFAFAVSSGVDYAIECELFVIGSNAANDFEFRFAVAAGTMTGRGNAVGVSAADASATTLISAAGAANTNQTPVGISTGTRTPVLVRFAFIPGSSTTFKLQFGNLVTGVGITSSISVRSRCRWRALQ